MDRRTFISSLGAIGATVAAGQSVFAAERKSGPKIGLIGCGWYGVRNLETFLRSTPVEAVSLCDVNSRSLDDGLQMVAKHQARLPKTFVDYREMLAAQHHDIIIVGTPNHWHALPAIAAMKAGADVFLEKPIGHDVMEGEAMVAAARKYGRVVQVNTQRRSTPHCARARDQYIRSGKLGPIALVESYSYFKGRLAEIVPDVPVPANLNYDLWTGPAPLTPFKAVKELKGWRNFSEYSNGLMGDVGVHMIDLVRWMLGLGWPRAIHCTGGIYVDKQSSADVTDTQRATFLYPDLEVSWEHRTWGPAPMPERHWTDLWGTRFIGRNGILNVNLLGYEFISADGKREGFNLLSKTGNLENIDFNNQENFLFDAESRHCLDFMRARETRGRPIADIEEGHISTACCELADIALQLGRALVYDPASRTVVNDPEATKLLAKPYRAPWVRPDPANV